MHEINFKKIILILKTEGVNDISMFLPISLCLILYKIISKVLVNHLKTMLNTCINEAQGAFVLGRLISDNVLVAYELMHSLKRKRFRKKGSFSLKLDMSKTYDCVEWIFLEGMMFHMGFDSSWVELIMHCISSVSYLVQINGMDNEVFLSGRGLL